MIKNRRRLSVDAALAIAIMTTLLLTSARTVRANDPEFDAITRHLKVHYNARRVSIPFLGLASFVVSIVKPAGVQSVKVAIFEDLNIAPANAYSELATVMHDALSPEWQPLVRARSRDWRQMYVYGRDEGTNLKLMVVTIDRSDAVVARVKISPKKLSEFLNNPKILGITINRQ